MSYGPVDVDGETKKRSVFAAIVELWIWFGETKKGRERPLFGFEKIKNECDEKGE